MFFFPPLLECVAADRDWSDTAPQCFRVQEAYVALNGVERKNNNEAVKTAVVKAYQLVPEAYRQQVQKLEKE